MNTQNQIPCHSHPEGLKQFLFVYAEDRDFYMNRCCRSYKNWPVSVVQSFPKHISDYEVISQAVSLEYEDLIEEEKTDRENISSRRLTKILAISREVPLPLEPPMNVQSTQDTDQSSESCEDPSEPPSADS